MNTSLKHFALILLACLMTTSCGENSKINAEQKRLYEEASKVEQKPLGARSSATIKAYQKVVALSPTTEWGIRAQQRIDNIRNLIETERIRRQIPDR